MSVGEDSSYKELISLLQAEFLQGEIVDFLYKNNELACIVKPESLLEVVTWLRDNPAARFVSLIDICGVDYPEKAKRFAVCYHLLSPYKNLRIRLKVFVSEAESVPSLCDIFAGANWYERETYDMYGVIFANHPDLRRLLTDYGFEGHPLRKDFPTTSFVECRYDEDAGRVIYEPVTLRQEMRNFDYISPWEGMDEPVRDAEIPIVRDGK